MQVAATAVGGTLMCMLLVVIFDAQVLLALPESERLPALFRDLLVPFAIALPNFAIAFWKIAELRVARAALEVLATTDGLTGTLNRRAFVCRVDKALDEAARGARQRTDALMVIDIDHFKRVNDTFGHEGGDEALQVVSAALSASLPARAVLGRLGGEEFAVFMHDVEPAVVTLAAENIRCAVAACTFEAGGVPYPLSVSIGVASAENACGFRDLYHQADLCLYAAKDSGRNRVVAKRLSPESRAVA